MGFFRRRSNTGAADGAEQDPFPRRKLGNKSQILLFMLLTVILTGLTVWGTRVWYKRSDTLTIAVGDPNGIEARFAAKLSAVLAASGSRIRLTPVASPDGGKAMTRFDRRQADLAILRTDGKVPSRARAIAILDRDVVLLISKKAKVKTLAGLKGQKIAVRGPDDGNETLLKSVIAPYDTASSPFRLQTVGTDIPLDKLLGADGFGAVVSIEHLSTLARDKRFEQFAKQHGGFHLNAIDEAKTIERRVPGVTSETIEARLLSSAPAIPDDDLTTIGWQWMLVAQAKLSETRIVDLARALFENKSDLALDNGFASKIEPADTDKDAYIVAHPGAAQYINDETKTFAERYTDLMYLALAAASIFGSIFVALYTAVTRTAPEKAGRLASAVLDVGNKIIAAKTHAELEAAQDQLEAILRRVLKGLRDGTVSSDGMETFRLGYEFVRDSLELHRQRLTRSGDTSMADRSAAAKVAARTG